MGDHQHHHHSGQDHPTDVGLGVTPVPVVGDHDAHHNPASHDMGHMMKMYFHGGYEEVVLFSFWQIDSIAGLIGSCIGLFLLAMLYEGLKVFREFLVERAACRDHGLRHRAEPHLGVNDGSGNHTPLNYPNGGVEGVEQVDIRSEYRPNPFSCSHILQSVLHVLQVTISYLLMLVVMTFNIWLTLAVVIGAGAGYFVFGWRKRVVVDINEHCH